MQNFNTNQTRHLYVAKVKKEKDTVTDNLDIALCSTATGELFFKYKNADGLVTRTDLFDPKKITSLKKAAADKLATKLQMAEVSADTDVIDFGASSSFIGKTIGLRVTIHGLFDYDDDNSKTILASVVGDKTNLADAKSLMKSLVVELAKNLVNASDPSYPLLRVFYGTTEVTKASTVKKLTGEETKFKIVQNPQKWVRGKLTGEPVNFSLSSFVSGGADSNTNTVSWLDGSSLKFKDSDITGYEKISGDYKIADLEYFALGERGDMIRGYNFPDNYEVTYAVVPGTNYDMLSIEYHYSGGAENVQKSPRLLEIAAPNSVVEALYKEVLAKMQEGVNAAVAAQGNSITSLDSKVTAAEKKVNEASTKVDSFESRLSTAEGKIQTLESKSSVPGA